MKSNIGFYTKQLAKLNYQRENIEKEMNYYNEKLEKLNNTKKSCTCTHCTCTHCECKYELNESCGCSDNCVYSLDREDYYLYQSDSYTDEINKIANRCECANEHMCKCSLSTISDSGCLC